MNDIKSAYRLSKAGLERIRGQKDDALKKKLAHTLGLTIPSINRFIRQNSWNGDLTKIKVVDILTTEFSTVFHDLYEQS
jgi:predicted xylose isomerase-like sugar epimerase